MKTWKPRQETLERRVRQSTESAARGDAAGSDPEIPAPIEDWLAQLRLLYGVPFEYLVPDYRMLPQESIRFYTLDRNWTDRAVEGALSIGGHSSKDVLFTQSVSGPLQRKLDVSETQVRSRMRDVDPPGAVVAGGTLTGFLLRSVVVSGWPGLEVNGYQGSPATKLDILRMDRVSADVLLVLFAGIPDEVDIMEPPEGLHFGVHSTAGSPPQPFVYLRGLGYGGFSAGEQILPAASVDVPTRQSGAYPGVLDVGQLQAALTSQLKGLGALDGQGTFTSAELAIQMVRAAGLQPFQPAPALRISFKRNTP